MKLARGPKCRVLRLACDTASEVTHDDDDYDDDYDDDDDDDDDDIAMSIPVKVSRDNALPKTTKMHRKRSRNFGRRKEE